MLDREVRLQAKLEVDAFNALDWIQARPVRLEFTLWEHQVIVQPDTMGLDELS